MNDSTILIVDDEEDIRLTIQAALDAEGYKTMTAATGAEALEAVDRVSPDVVLLDIMMPDIDGRQVCRRIKENAATRGVAVVFASALRETKDKVIGLDVGADDYITKPYNMAELTAKIRAHCRIQGYRRQLERVVDFAHSMNTVEMDAISIAIATKLERLLPAERYSIFLLDEEDEGVLRALIHNHGDEDMNALSVSILDSPIMKEALETGRRIITSDFPSSKYAAGERRSKYTDGHALCAPLIAGGQRLGALNLNGSDKGFFDNIDFNTVELVTQMISAALNNARAMSKLRRMAITDGLTRLYNHRHFHEILGLEFERASRYGQPLSLVMMDIDFFKRINDTHGHPVGDTILADLAERLKKHVRKIDTLARYGGEEFAILLPQTGVDKARVLAERIRRDTERRPFRTEKEGLGVTVSLGVCGMETDGAGSPAELVNKADEALYRAKREGRNRVIVCGSGEEER
ncbi:MAG: diguanylate cyclase [Candidatus Nitrospinota bacterium M3_3B_026]